VSRYKKGKTNLDFTEARDSEWQWHQLGHNYAICTLLQTGNHASTPPLRFFTGRMPFLPPNQQRQSTEGAQHKLKANSHRHARHDTDSTVLSCLADGVNWALLPQRNPYFVIACQHFNTNTLRNVRGKRALIFNFF